MNCSDSQIPRDKSLCLPTWQLFRRPVNHGDVTQKLRNSSLVYHKTNDPFGAKICMISSFQLLLYTMKVEFQEDQ